MNPAEPETKQIENLVVTIEHSQTGKMGGIGSYNDEIGKLSDNIAFLLVDDEISESPAANIILCHKYLEKNAPELMAVYQNYKTRGYAIVSVVKMLLKEFPNIKNIDTHEYSGVGARVAEAACSGLLGPNIRVRTHCHGGHIQLERATGTWRGIDGIEINALERSSIENADEVWFSSNYLKDLYIASGMQIDAGKTHVLGLPYELRELSSFEQPEYTPVKHLVFVGRMNRLKGYEVFTEVVNYLVGLDGFAEQLESVRVIGKDDGSMPEQTAQLEALADKHNFKFICELMTRNQVLEFELAHAHDSLYILPYMSDNYSVAMLELVEANAPLIALDTGGNKELIDDFSWRDRLGDDTAHLCTIAESYVKMAPQDRRRECRKLYELFVEAQTERNEKNAHRFHSFASEKHIKESKPIEVIMLGESSPASSYLSLELSSLKFSRGNKQLSLQEVKKLLKSRHVFLVETDRKVDNLEETVESVSQAAAMKEDACWSVSTVADNIAFAHMPLYLDLGVVCAYPGEAFLRNLCLPAEDFLSYLERYTQFATHKPLTYFLAGLTFCLAAGQKRIIPMPLMMHGAYTEVRGLAIDEAIFPDMAKLSPSYDWVQYRYMALIRENIMKGADGEHYAGPQYVSAYADFIKAVAQRNNVPAKLLKTILKIQIWGFGAATKVKKKLS